jgi:hypothetical protein
MLDPVRMWPAGRYDQSSEWLDDVSKSCACTDSQILLSLLVIAPCIEDYQLVISNHCLTAEGDNSQSACKTSQLNLQLLHACMIVKSLWCRHCTKHAGSCKYAVQCLRSPLGLIRQPLCSRYAKYPRGHDQAAAVFCLNVKRFPQHPITLPIYCTPMGGIANIYSSDQTTPDTSYLSLKLRTIWQKTNCKACTCCLLLVFLSPSTTSLVTNLATACLVPPSHAAWWLVCLDWSVHWLPIVARMLFYAYVVLLSTPRFGIGTIEELQI